MTNKIKKITICLFIIFLILPYISGCEEKEKKKIEKIAVKAVRVERNSLKEFLFYVGDIKAEDEAIIYPKVSGKIIEKLVKEGESVKKGDILVYIDRDEVGFQFEKAPVESSIDGIVGRVYVDIGASVSIQTPVALIVNMDIVKVKINIVEIDLPKIEVGQLAEVYVDAYTGEVFKGVVERVSPVVDLTSRTAVAEISIPNADYRLKSGMFARIKILVDEKEDVLIIPRDAIIRENSSYYAFIVKSDNVVERRRIEIGLNENNKFEIINGLNQGEFVVTMGNTLLKEGDTVEVVRSP